MKKELEWILERCKANNIVAPQAKGKDYCRYLNDIWECVIYEVRPKICRMYWTKKHPALTCPEHPEEAIGPESQDDANYKMNIQNDWVFL